MIHNFNLPVKKILITLIFYIVNKKAKEKVDFSFFKFFCIMRNIAFILIIIKQIVETRPLKIAIIQRSHNIKKGNGLVL